MTVRITVWDRYIDLDRRGVAAIGRNLGYRHTIFALEFER